MLLNSTNPEAGVPASVTVPAGKGSVTFTITPKAVSANSPGAITATVGAQTLTRQLTVRPLLIKSIVLSPDVTNGGTEVTATITLECGAAPGDLTVALSSTKSTVARPLVSSLLFPQGTSVLSFQVETFGVSATATPKIRATLFGKTKAATLTVNP